MFALFDSLAAYYIEGRYPTFKDKISTIVDKDKANQLLKKTKEAFQWMKSLK